MLSAFLALAASAAVVTHGGAASASVSLAVAFDDLVREATTVDVITPVEQHAVWENGRIYTYTRVHVERPVAGAAMGQDGWVRTMGGVVGKVGQAVEGEPVFTVGRPSLLFLHPGPAGVLEVTARAQGQYPLVRDDAGGLRLVRSATLGVLLKSARGLEGQVYTPPQGLGPRAAAPLSPRVLFAADAIHGRTVDEVARDVVAAWARTHAK